MNFLGTIVNTSTFDNNSTINQYFMRDNTHYIGYAKLIFPLYNSNSFHSILAVDKLNQIIPNSNSFFIDNNFQNTLYERIEYNNIHTIFTRLEITHKYLIENSVDIKIDEEMFLLCNPFSSTNIGHDLSILLERIHIYKTLKLSMPVVLSEFMHTIPRSIEICKLLLPDIAIYFLPNNKIIEFKKLHITPNAVMDIFKHSYLIKEIIINALNSNLIKNNIDSYKNKKILLIKTNRNNNVITKSTAFIGDNTINMLCEKYDYIYINPELMNMYEIIAYLYNASKIVTSFGAISYAHTIFFNPNISYYFLKTNYNPYFFLEKHIIINMVSLNLDDMYNELPKLLNDI
jgi:hypothetical protein